MGLSYECRAGESRYEEMVHLFPPSPCFRPRALASGTAPIGDVKLSDPQVSLQQVGMLPQLLARPLKNDLAFDQNHISAGD